MLETMSLFSPSLSLSLRLLHAVYLALSARMYIVQMFVELLSDGVLIFECFFTRSNQFVQLFSAHINDNRRQRRRRLLHQLEGLILDECVATVAVRVQVSVKEAKSTTAYTRLPPRGMQRISEESDEKHPYSSHRWTVASKQEFFVKLMF